MNRTNFEHAAYGILMMAVVGFLAQHVWVGAAFGIAFFLGREHAQAQAKLGDYTFKGDIKAFDIRQWSLDSKYDLFFPIIGIIVLASMFDLATP